MRTRRSWKNQDKLFSALFKPDSPALSVVQPEPRCWDCVSYPKGGRSRGACAIVGVSVSGSGSCAKFSRRTSK